MITEITIILSAFGGFVSGLLSGLLYSHFRKMKEVLPVSVKPQLPVSTNSTQVPTIVVYDDDFVSIPIE